MFKSLNMELTPMNSLKVVLMVAVIANLFAKYSKNIKVNNTFVIISLFVIIATIFYDFQVSALLFLLFLTIFYNSKHISFNLIPIVHRYNENEAIEAFEGGNTRKEVDEEYDENEDNNENINSENYDINANDNVEDKLAEMIKKTNNKKNNHNNHINNNDVNNNNVNNNNDVNDNDVNNNDVNNNDVNNNNDNNNNDANNNDVNNDNNNNNINNEEQVENFEEPINIPDELKGLKSMNDIKNSIKLNQHSEEQDLDDFISHSVYVPFEKLNAVQNNQIQSFDNDQEFIAAIDEGYYEKISY